MSQLSRCDLVKMILDLDHQDMQSVLALLVKLNNILSQRHEAAMSRIVCILFLYVR